MNRPILDAEQVQAGSTTSISIQHLSKTFRRTGGREVRAIDDVSVTIDAGEMLVLLGPSGCGKTTLLRAIGGLELPDRGEIAVHGKTVFSSAKKINTPPEKRYISMMFQSYAVWPHMTVSQNVAYPLHGRGLTQEEARRRVQRSLDMVGVGHLGEQHPGQLSGGQQQRVALARSLVVEPRVVLFDEPLSNVDAKVRDDLRFELMTKQKELGFAGVYVTHDQSEALQLADRLAVLDTGKIIQIGTPEEIYNRPNSYEVASFIGTVNKFPGKFVRAVSDNRVEIETAEGLLIGRPPDTGLPALGAGSPVIAIIRAESLFLTDQSLSASDGHVFSGTLVAEVFAGSYVEYAIELRSGNIRLHSRDVTHRGMPAATPLRVGARSGDIMIFPT